MRYTHQHTLIHKHTHTHKHISTKGYSNFVPNSTKRNCINKRMLYKYMNNYLHRYAF